MLRKHEQEACPDRYLYFGLFSFGVGIGDMVIHSMLGCVHFNSLAFRQGTFQLLASFCVSQQTYMTLLTVKSKYLVNCDRGVELEKLGPKPGWQKGKYDN